MAFNGAGVFNRIYNWVTDATNLIDITATRMDAEMDGMATGLSNCLTKDGQTAATGNLPMGTYRHTGVGDASARTHYAVTGQVQDGSYVWCAVGGTVDAITLTPTPAITAYAAGQVFRFIAAGANTGAVTVAVSGLATKTVLKNGATALAAGDFPSGSAVEITYDGTQFQASVSTVVQATTSLQGKVELATSAETVTGTDTARAVTAAGVTAKMSAPGPIGNTTPGTGSFTNLTVTQNLIQKQGVDVASATALTLGDGNIFDITGTTTITSIATKGIGALVILQFDGALTLTHHATDLILPNGANITTAAGDIAVMYEYATGDWRCVSYRGGGYVKVSDVKASGTDGGTFTSAAWRTRTLNTEDSDSSGLASVASNQITLAAGTYDCFISAPGNQCAFHRARLYDTTGVAVLVAGGNVASTTSVGACIRSEVRGRFTIAVQSVLEVQHFCTVDQATNGFGLAVTSGESEVYTIAEFWRIP